MIDLSCIPRKMDNLRIRVDKTTRQRASRGILARALIITQA